MVKKHAIFIDASYIIKNNKTYVALLLKGKKTAKLYYQYNPYFYVDAPKDMSEQILNMKIYKEDGGLVSPVEVEECERNIGLEKKKMLKISCKEPSHVPIIKASIPYPSYEYNIPFARRFIFDMNITPLSRIEYERKGKILKKIISITPGDKKLSTMSFDIETYNPVGSPREDKDPVIMISYCGKTTGVITSKKSTRDFVETVVNEKAILEKLNEIIKKEDPDVLFGYNSANFDLPYLKARAAALKTKLNLGRYGDELREVKRGLIKGIKLKGRVHFDLYPMAKFFGFIGVIKSQRFTLDAVAEDVLGSNKLKIKKDDIWQMWDSGDIDKLCDYSLVDAELTLALGERFLPIDIELSSVAKMPLFDTTISTSGQLVENLLMFHATERKEVIPSKPLGNVVSERINAPIQGAFVKLPEPGIYENVAVLDFRGLYPSIIVSYNIDPGTLVIDDDDVNESPTGAKFSKKQIGLIPFVLDYLIDMRMILKKTIKTLDKSSEEHVKISARSQALKILANSFYGYMGYARSRWYSRQCAESVTAWGRKHIMETIETAEKSGFQVLYADTDSVFILYKDKQDVLNFMENINKTLPQKMELELEGFYPRGVFVSKKGSGERGAKKKYALLAEDGRIKIRGFELVRRDWSKIAKDTQLKVLEAILKDGSKEKAVKIIRDVVKRLQEGKVPLELLAISTQLNKNPDNYEVASPELSAAKKLIKSGAIAEKGTMISYVIGKRGKSISEKAEPLELAKDYDSDYYINNQILPAVMKIMKELGYDEHSMKFGGRQESLDSFF
ncbi:MAG: DNA-directed DNA polymerase [Candidatus Micrarchaeota archaeon]